MFPSPMWIGVSTLLVGGLSILVFCFQKYRLLRQRLPGIPYLNDCELLGKSGALRPDAHHLRLRSFREHGPLIQLHFFGFHCVVVNDGRLVKFALENIKGKGILQQLAFLVNNTISLDTNAAWKSRRQAFRHAFTNTSLKHHDTCINKLLDKMCEILDRHATEHSVVLIDDLFTKFVLDVIYCVGFVLDKNFLDDDEAYHELNENIAIFMKYTCWAKFLPFRSLLIYTRLIPALNRWYDASEILRKYQMEVLNNMKSKYQSNLLPEGSFAKIILDFAGQENLTEEEILSELLLFILAGHETSAHTMSWFIYSLAKNPLVQIRCQEVAKEELTASENGKDSIPTENIASSFKLLPSYLEAALKESMRKYNVGGRAIARQIHEPDGIDFPVGLANKPNQPWKYPESVHLKKGTWVCVHPFALHNDPNNWGPDAHEFKPERWLDRSNCSSAALGPAAYGGFGPTSDSIIFAPFSAGARNCIGMNMAMWEIRAVVARLVRNYTFEFADDDLLDDYKAMEASVTNKPLKQLPMFVKFLKK